ncbi:deoxyribonuclease V [Fodinibius sediminis]|nr:deoxyribonuclease V [Fodinibius sediminis]
MRIEDYKTIAPEDAVQLQRSLRACISITALGREVATVGGADISYNRGSGLMHAAMVVLELPGLRPVAYSLASDETSFPYIPGLLAFREMPALMKAWSQLRAKPDVLMLDGHGLAHPRRMGIATHFGIEADQPTIGCAKNILTGTHGELGVRKGEQADLMDGEEKVGIALRSRTNVNPVYVSPGHRCSFEDAYRIVMQSLTKYKLPRTTRLAHRWANMLRRGEAEPGYTEV